MTLTYGLDLTALDETTFQETRRRLGLVSEVAGLEAEIISLNIALSRERSRADAERVQRAVAEELLVELRPGGPQDEILLRLARVIANAGLRP